MRPVALLWIAVLAGGCLTRSAPPRLPNLTPVAVAYVVDDEHQGTIAPVPRGFEEAIARILAEHNLAARPVEFQQFSEAIRGRRDSQARFRQLERLAPDAPFRLLVETKAKFFSQLNGRYRWEVNARASAARKGEESGPATTEVAMPALLQYSHERDAEALTYAAPLIAERVSSLFAGIIREVPGASEPPTAPAAEPQPR